MATLNVDVCVIGMGPGGEEVATRLAEAGLRVVGVEKELVGGECPYWGCVPSKMMVRAADLLAETGRVEGMAGRAQAQPDWAPVAQRIRAEATDDWDDTVAVERFTAKGGRFLRGAARLDGPGRVVVGDDVIEAERGVVVATGAVPSIPPIEGLADVDYWTNRGAVKAESVPDTMVVLGGGAIGLELAQAMGRFGTRCSIVEGLERLLPLEEPEAGAVIAERLRAEGHEVQVGARALRVRQAGGGFEVELEGGGLVRGERLLVSTGRHPNLGGLNLASVGLDPDARALAVDGHMRAGERLWGVGDVTGIGQFTHLAIYHAGYAVADILGGAGATADHRALPRVTFTDPEVGSVGLSEAQARERGLRVRTGTAQVASSARGWIHGPGNQGFIKLVADADAGVLAGATSCGPWGGEVLALLTLAVHARVPVARLRDMIYAYPTFHRGVLDALTDLGGEGVG